MCRNCVKAPGKGLKMCKNECKLGNLPFSVILDFFSSSKSWSANSWLRIPST